MCCSLMVSLKVMSEIEDQVWHASEVEEVFRTLETDERGLTESEVKERLLKYGANELKEEKGISKFSSLIGQLKNPLVGVLVSTALISFLVR